MTNEVFEYLKSRALSFNTTSDELDAIIKEHNRRCELTHITISEIEKLKEKAMKWNMIEWAIENNVRFAECCRCGGGTYLAKFDIELLEKLYTERR